jgi:hypothetical protein
MKNYKQVNNITGWVVFLIASVVYLMTIEPTASFWDCGEFISSAYKLQVGHPPGAPVFMLVARFFSLFASDPTQVAKMVNAMSALSSSATILFLFWTITHLGKKMLASKEKTMTAGQALGVLGAGVVGALAYTFSDTFWFSAVEGEVYALSSLFTAIVFWVILKWEDVADQPHATRWIILIAYLMGLSIGVHLLNLLAIPAIALVYYFKKYEVTRKGLVTVIGISFFILLAIMYGIIPGIVKVAARFELLFVNRLGLGFNSGILVYIILLLSSLVWGIYDTLRKEPHERNWIIVTASITLLGVPFMANNVLLGLVFIIGFALLFYFLKSRQPVLNMILTAGTVIVLGYSSFAMIFIRSSANPPMDQNNPETMFGLQYYLNREQYGDTPLFYGPYYTAPIEGTEETKPIYSRVGDKYEVTGHKVKYIYNSDLTTLFPRMYSQEQHHIKAYEQWGRVKGTKVRVRGEDGKPATLVKPTFGENLRFFFRYQVNFMYMRYFYWNFVGRQNDIQGNGYNEEGHKDVLNGNWLSGIKFIDEARLGPQDNIPESLAGNKARNTYYFLPLLLGLLGAFFHYKKNKKDFYVVLVLFFMTGLAIVLYLNQNPYQPRERDYAYAGSFYAFAIWIGLGVMMVADWIKKISNATIGAVAATLGCLVLVPGIMAKENWDDHDRSGCYTARDFAWNYLHSCKPNSILFTNGDNDTFPLWYLQEVEGVRTDMRVCNLSYLSADWYIEQMQHKAYESEPLPFTMQREHYLQGNRDAVYIMDEIKKPIDLVREAMPWVASDDKRTKVGSGSNTYDFFPSRDLYLTVDKQKVVENDIIHPKYAPLMVDTMHWRLPGRYVTKNHLMVLDLLAGNDWKRPVYFAITVPRSNYINLDKYFQTTGLAYQIVPVEENVEQGIVSSVNTEEMFGNMMNKFRWGGVSDPNVYLNENNRRMLMNFRNNFAQLAEALINEGQPDKAKMALDRSLEAIPDTSVSFNYIMLPYVGLYANVGEKELSKNIARKIEDRLSSELDYYLKFRGEFARSVSYEFQINMSVLRRLAEIAESLNDPEESQRLQEKFMDYYRKFQMIM